MIEFLQRVLAKTGYYCIAVPATTQEGHNYFQHHVVETLEEFCKLAEKFDAQKKNVFYSVGTLKERKLFNADYTNKQTGEKGKWEVRTHANMSHFKSLILDIDCNGKKEKEYKDKNEGLAALKHFCRETGFPRPTIVDSGGGLHVYWPLTSELPSHVWHTFAVKFDKIVKHYKFKADSSRTQDRSSVLRVPGTNNHKNDTPRAVKLVYLSDEYDPLDIKAIIKKNMEFLGIKEDAPKPVISKELADLFGSNINTNEPANGAMVLKHCLQMKRMIETGGADCSEPLWVAGLSIARRFDVPKCHEISNGYHGYSYEGTESKVSYQENRNYGAALCETFEAENPGGCDGCEYKGKVKSPIVIGNKIIQIKDVTNGYDNTQKENDVVQNKKEDVPVVEESAAESPWGFDDTPTSKPKDEVVKKEEGLPVVPPYPFVRSTKGIVMQANDGEGGFEPPVIVFEGDLYPKEVLLDGHGHMVVKVYARVGMDSPKEFEMDMSVFADFKAFNKLVMQQGIIAIGQEKQGLLHTYMLSYIKEIQDKMKSTKNFSQLGWNEDGKVFVLPEYHYTEEGEKVPSGVSKTIANTARAFKKAGTLEEWKKVIDMYNRPGYENYAFAHLVGYGSVLFRFTNYAGAIVSLMGNSGSGKSTVLKTVNSIFAHPTDPMLVLSDKPLAKINRIGILNSICATADELTNIENDEFGELAYEVSQGRGRNRLNSDASEKINETSWNLIMLVSTNASLINKLSVYKSDASAEAMRVFEFTMSRQNVLSKEDAMTEIDDRLAANYGHAGDIFIEYVVQHQDEVRDLIRKVGREFDTLAGITTMERYWSAVVATSLAGGIIAKQLGLCAFDIESIKLWVADQVRQMRGTVASNTRGPEEMLVEFLNQNIGYTLVVGGGQSKDKPIYTLQEAHGKIFVRNEVDTGWLFVDRVAIRKWLTTSGSDYLTIKKALTDCGVLYNDAKDKVLGANSNIKTGQSKCWMISLKHPSMAGVGVTPVESKPAVDGFGSLKNI